MTLTVVLTGPGDRSWQPYLSAAYMWVSCLAFLTKPASNKLEDYTDTKRSLRFTDTAVLRRR